MSHLHFFSGESALVVTVLCLPAPSSSSAAQMHSKCTKQPSATYFHLFFWRAIAAAVAPKNSVSIGRKRGAGGNGFGGLLKRFSSPLPFWCHCPPFPPSCAYVHVAWLRMCFLAVGLGWGGKGGREAYLGNDAVTRAGWKKTIRSVGPPLLAPD